MTSGANIRRIGRKLCLRAAEARPLRVLSLASAALLGATISAPAYADAEIMEAQIAVVRPLSFIKVEDLHFGRVIASGTAGTVTLAPDGVRTRTGGATLAGTEGSQVARFAGDGTQNQLVNISIGANSIFITGPGAQMRVRNFVIGSVPVNNLTTNPVQLRLSSAPGTFNFGVGATLEVGANQAPGTYTGTWTITLNYQ